jgi:hypothetical protein
VVLVILGGFMILMFRLEPKQQRSLARTKALAEKRD